METRFRTPTGEVQWMHAAPGAAAAAAEEAFGPASGERTGARELLGAVFTSAKDLRHLAEQHFAEEFIPTRVLAESSHFGVFALDAPDGRVTVHAERERHWHPFRITRVEQSPGDAAPPRGEGLGG
jgi:hypothetical protein